MVWFFQDNQVLNRIRELKGNHDPRHGASGGSQGPRQPGKTAPQGKKPTGTPPTSNGPSHPKQTSASGSNAPKASGSRGAQDGIPAAARAVQSSPAARPEPADHSTPNEGIPHKVQFDDGAGSSTTTDNAPSPSTSKGSSYPQGRRKRNRRISTHGKRKRSRRKSRSKSEFPSFSEGRSKSRSGSISPSSSEGSSNSRERRSSQAASKKKKLWNRTAGKRKRIRSTSGSHSKTPSPTHSEVARRVSFGYAEVFEASAAPEAPTSETQLVNNAEDQSAETQRTSDHGSSQSPPKPLSAADNPTPCTSILLKREEKPQKSEGMSDAPLTILKILKPEKNGNDGGVLQEHFCSPRIITYIMAVVVLFIVVTILVVLIQGLRQV